MRKRFSLSLNHETIFFERVTKVSIVLQVVGMVSGAMMLGKFSVPGCLLVGIIVGQESTALALDADNFEHFFYRLSFLFFVPLSRRRRDID